MWGVVVLFVLAPAIMVILPAILSGKLNGQLRNMERRTARLEKIADQITNSGQGPDQQKARKVPITGVHRHLPVDPAKVQNLSAQTLDISAQHLPCPGVLDK
jgi:hypothetical protein